MSNFYDVFISYGRADSKVFATSLSQHLVKNGLKVWFDQNDIPPGVDFQNQINDGIEKSHNFLFIIAPHSVKSVYCLKEIALAVQYNKIIIPILHVNSDAYLQQMHPIIQKLNWIFFTEKEQFEKSFKLLIELIKRHQNYVEQHTYFLSRALDWIRNYQKNEYLLVNDNRSQAESWLKLKFQDEQAPCEPTDLHSEYITESIKNANNLMTDAFIPYIQQDKTIALKISKSLRRESLTVTLKDLNHEQNLISQSIAESDNFIYLISQESCHSELYQQALEQALTYHKRIIPILINQINVKFLNKKVKKTEFIDLFNIENCEIFKTGISHLIKVIEEEKFYYKNHKILLTKALKWQKQNYNTSLLLRGHNLHHYQTWIKIATNHPFSPPTNLQIQFLEASTNQPTDLSIEVFISYSRADSDFARKINEALQELGKTTWFDQECIPSGSNYEKEIEQGIANSDNFLLIISPQSVTSSYCAHEVNYAKQLNKRFITIVYQEIDSSSLYPELQEVQWINFHQNGDFSANFNELIRTIETDRNHVHAHTKWLQRAREWILSEKNSDLLLRGTEFSLAENWLGETEKGNKKPLATDLQKDYIQASKAAILIAQEAEKRRQEEILLLQKERAQEAEARLAEQKKRVKVQNRLLSSVIIALGIVISLVVMIHNQYQKSRRDEITAIAAYSQSLFARHFQLKSLTEAIQAGEKLEQLGIKDAKIESAIKEAVYRISEYNHLIGHQGNVLAVQFSPDGQKIATSSDDNTIKLWAIDGHLIKTLSKHHGSVNTIAFRQDSKVLATGSVDNTVTLWQEDGSYLSTLRGHTHEVTSVAFSPDGQWLVSGSRDKTIKLWKRNSQGTNYNDYKTLKVGNEVNTVAFSPDGQWIVSGHKNGKVNLWKQDGTFLKTIGSHQDQVTKVIFSPDGQLLASASWDQTVQLWKKDPKNSSNYLKDQTLMTYGGTVWDIAFNSTSRFIICGNQNATIEFWQTDGIQWNWTYSLYGHEGPVKALAYNPQFQINTQNIALASASSGNIVQLWKPNNNKLLKYGIGHAATVADVDISPDNHLVASASFDKTIKLWKIEKNLTSIKTLKGHQASVTSLKISPDGKFIASGSTDNTVNLWTIEGKLLKRLHHDDDVYDVDISPDSQWIVSGSRDKTVKIWRRDGTLIKTLRGHTDAVRTVVISPDGQLIASGSGDNKIKIWRNDGTLLQTLSKHQSPVLGVDFSPDSQLLVSGGEDNTITLWKRDIKNYFSFSENIVNNNEPVLNIMFSPDGQSIASASDDGITRLWGLKGNLKAVYPGHLNQVYGLNFSPDGKSMVTGGTDQIVILWNLTDKVDINQLLHDGCEWLHDYLKNNPSKNLNNICQNFK